MRPDQARRGIGRALLERCEAEAREHGFTSMELCATLTGQRLYRALGYVDVQLVEWPLRDGISIAFELMRKGLPNSSTQRDTD